jgi:hypothetical protein
MENSTSATYSQITSIVIVKEIMETTVKDAEIKKIRIV